MGMLVERASCLFLRLSGMLVEWACWWNGHLAGTGMLVERACWWNGHVGGTGMLVERACWWNGHVGGMGMLVEWACWWNGHVGGMGMLVEWASCPLQFPDGQDAHPTPIHPLIQQLPCIQLSAIGQRLTADG
ncbi:MAG: hypothetical protein F6K37_18210 [Moorea sp. SIO4E2]|uniref:hypothetical protein n=1 Tax=Moorena sp. SIO4E2 TaxID=2607826 RepID=UPI0013B7803E|nr:hypothetical protein [Moorena sp. SIO4E2]NEQ07806.1 hypothetical protein [Moorena sp. SIO4E2]